jgi:Methyltransferase FkbM domain
MLREDFVHTGGVVSLQLKLMIASAFLHMGATLGKQSNEMAVRDLIRRMRARSPAHQLIRIGGANDGGYLLPDDIEGIVECFSPGVGSTSTFEEDMVRRRVPCFLADASVEAPFEHDLVNFERRFIGVTYTEQATTLDEWVGRCAPPEGDLLLQMDVEGAEWPSLLSITEHTLRRFRIIVMEMHDLDRLFDRVGFSLIGNALDRLLFDFDVVHIHPNNSAGRVSKKEIVLPRVMEATFLRKDRAKTNGFSRQFPHPLDMPNTTELRDIVLPDIWRGE